MKTKENLFTLKSSMYNKKEKHEPLIASCGVFAQGI
jgi:hypothetical protein